MRNHGINESIRLELKPLLERILVLIGRKRWMNLIRKS